MSKHTPGPWTYSGGPVEWTVYAPDSSEYAAAGDLVIPASYCTEANARRIVTCVNACEGISTEALESGVVAEMLAAMIAVRDTCPADSDIHPKWEAAWDALRAAIAKAVGR